MNIRWNLGLGDAIICNGLIRFLAAHRAAKVTVPALEKNIKSVRFMFRDNRNIEVVQTDGAQAWDAGADNLAIDLGQFRANWKIRTVSFDQEFYIQGGVDFNVRWDWFFVPRDRPFEIRNGQQSYAFVHDDRERGWVIPDPNLPVFRPAMAHCIFDYYPAIVGATEIHCIDSAFACWIDSMPENGQKLFFHNIKPIDNPLSRLTRRRNWIEV